MKKIMYLLSIGLMVSLLGCGSTTATKEMPVSAPATKVTTPAPTPTPAPAPALVEKKWVAVKSWSGSGIKKTENFEITGSDWRVNWKSDGKNGNNSILVYSLYPHIRKMALHQHLSLVLQVRVRMFLMCMKVQEHTISRSIQQTPVGRLAQKSKSKLYQKMKPKKPPAQPRAIVMSLFIFKYVCLSIANLNGQVYTQGRLRNERGGNTNDD